MGLSTLNGHRVTSGRATIPAWGCWHASVTLDSEVTIAPGARATLVMADLTLVGTVLSGGPALGRSLYRIVAGAGGWGRTVRAWSYSDDAGVKLATAIGDAAREAGETLAAIPSSSRTGPAWTREEGPASLTLNTLAPAGWYVDEAGVTHVGARAAGTLPAKVTRVAPVDFARGKVVLASEFIAAILPGVVVDGLTAVDVQHDVSADGGLRSTVWGGPIGSAAESMRKLVQALDPDRNFRGVSEYRIDTRSGARLNLQPVRVSSGMPYIKNVPVWFGLPGASATPPLGSIAYVTFADADPSRPGVVGFEDGAASSGLELITDGVGTGGHAITLEQVLGLFAQYTAARFVLGDLGATFSPVYTAAPPGALLSLMALMVAGATLPATPVGPTPGSVLDSLGLPALITTALALQLPDPASLGLPTPVIPGLAKKNFLL